jgi:hypothetical protein
MKSCGVQGKSGGGGDIDRSADAYLIFDVRDVKLSRRQKSTPRSLNYLLPFTHKMTKFRPCIDLHAGSVKQIVGGTLTTTTSELKTNFTSKLPSSYYADLYKQNALEGAHVIMLGPGNEEACREACEAWPGHLQVGGGINDGNAKGWIEKGASKVCFVARPSKKARRTFVL